MTTENTTAETHQIGRYRVTGELGRGGMGVVYRGEDPLIGRQVAIKTLTEVTPELRERFYLEARSGILNHPNIVTVYEVGEDGGNPFIAMELIAGESLEKVLRLRKRLPLLEALSIVDQLCAGLGYAHGHGVVHRDVKPANVLLQPDGRVTIVDFGIARLADQTRQLTKTDALLGTFHYIAPERLKGEPSDGRGDIWSVGVMLYELLTGELPFKGRDLSALYRIIHEPYVPLEEFVQDLPDGLRNVLDRALAKTLDARYATAEEMAFDLQLIADALKHDRVEKLLASARRLAEERQFASARTVLLQAQRIDPGNSDTKALMSDVQASLNQLQRGEQLRQIVEQAQSALTERRWDDALMFYAQAQKLDTDNSYRLEERIQNAQGQKSQQQKLMSLWQQASEARNRGDLIMAQNCLERALEIDERSTDLRNAYSVVLREVKRKQQGLQVQALLRNARDEYSLGRYTEAIAQLREAAEIDPSDTEVQQLLFSAATRQKEERRQQALDKIVVEIQDCLDRDDFTLALDRVARALETLPGESVLLRLKAETEKKKREFETQQTVRNAVLQAQDMFVDDPKSALREIEKGLEQAAGNETLLQAKARLEEHLQDLKKDEAYAKALEEAHAAIDAGRYADARRVLESAMVTHGPNRDLEQLLDFAEDEQRKAEQEAQRAAQIREVEDLVQAGKLQDAVKKLETLVSTNGDPVFASLLDDLRRKQQKTMEQAALVAQHARTLAATNPQGALQMLSEQPQEIRTSEPLRALEEELRREDEVARALAAAVAACDRALVAGDLDKCMRALDEQAKKHGEHAVEKARKRCEDKRQEAADALLVEAIRSAREMLAAGSKKEALRAMRRAERAQPYAGGNAQKEWQRLETEVAGTASRKQTAPNSDSKKSSRAVWYVIGCLVAVAVIAAIGLSRIRARELHAPAPAHTPVPVAVVRTYMQLNASPWATVISVQDASGKDTALPEEDQTTPMRLDGVAVGKYKVTFEGPNQQQQTVACEVSVEQHLCTAEISPVDMRNVVTGEKP